METYIKNNMIYVQVIFESNSIYYISFLLSNDTDYIVLGTNIMTIIGVIIDFKNEKVFLS